MAYCRLRSNEVSSGDDIARFIRETDAQRTGHVDDALFLADAVGALRDVRQNGSAPEAEDAENGGVDADNASADAENIDPDK
ncbi:hypothetical protein [Halorubrum lacusprofundi]|uniref:hypothetical protein n=1 Tax=Halorubrum lacusprofundi TaxID=2247 RepID=UPI000158E113|nr:hypothetical protein [Halorubrum lacusprofundi]MCG1005708.1 hypothetical protein [Halorubrum lacusprofundi]